MSSELDGVHARVQLHTRTPVFYLLYEEDFSPGDNTRDADSYSFVIEHVTVAEKKRVVDALSFNSLTLHAKRNDKLVETTVTKMPGGWLRIEPNRPMDEGEYCILPVPKSNGTYSTEVYDFGIDPNAPNEKDAIAAVNPVLVN
ncbi:MAG TPA: hypothetical protein VMV57_00950 [Terracidiphilus sp.]|nr:hypothetical protein [Terracidiphilus sp.]